MGAAHGTPFELVENEMELRRETKDFARWTLDHVTQLHRRFKQTFGFALTASQFQSLLLLQAPTSVGIEEIFELLDTDHDGRIDGLEFLAALGCICRADFEDKARFAFDLFDFNDNGALSVSELALLIKSVFTGMTLFSERISLSNVNQATETLSFCLELATNAFSHSEKSQTNAGLKFHDFIIWARSNRAFMLQIEHFRLHGEKQTIDLDDLPDGEDDEDSDLEMEMNGGNLRTSDNEMPAIMGPYVSSSCPSFPSHAMPPPVNFELEWIYGTSGSSARHGCRFVRTDEAVYFVGRYVILYSSERHEQRYYCGHKRAIQCLDVNASAELVATGENSDQDAEIHVWKAQSFECLAVLRSFHPKGVAFVRFPATAGDGINPRGDITTNRSWNMRPKLARETEMSLLASVGTDESGTMAVWNWKKESLVASGRAARREKPLALALNEEGDEMLVVGVRFVVFYQVTGRGLKPYRPQWHGIGDHHPPVQTMPICTTAVYLDPHTAIVGTSRGELLLFERHRLMRWIQAHEAHQSVNVCVRSCSSLVVFSAGKDGQIKQWDATLRPLGQSVDLQTLLLTHSSSYSISHTNVTRDDFRLSSLDYDPKRQRFLLATRIGNIYELYEDHVDASTTSFQCHVIANGHPNAFTQTLATAGGVFASCGVNDRWIKISSLRRRRCLQCLDLKTTFPSALEFSSEGEWLAIGSQDGTLLLAQREETGRKKWTIETTRKDTSSCVVAMRFGPFKQEQMLVVSCENGYIYLYQVVKRQFKRFLLLQSKDEPARALDFSIDGAFLRTQHGNATFICWDLRPHAGGSRLISKKSIQNVEWYTHTVVTEYEMTGFSYSTIQSADVVDGIRWFLSNDGSLNFVSRTDTSCWLLKRVANAHLTKENASMCGKSALRGKTVLTSSNSDAAICQWRVEKELKDVQPRPPCVYNQQLATRLQLIGLKDVYFSENDENEPNLSLKSSGKTLEATLSQHSESPDLALSLSYVYGFDHSSTSLNQSLASLGSDIYVYPVGPMLVLRSFFHSSKLRSHFVPSGLKFSISCLVKHPTEPILAVGSRHDNCVMLFRIEKTGYPFHQLATLKSNNGKKRLISVNFCENRDIVAIIWKNTCNHVHSLVIYAWKRETILVEAEMTQFPVLFGTFLGSSGPELEFLSGGVDHVTFWQFDPATNHLKSQNGVFGRHALVQMIICAVYVAPFVLTGGENGSIVLWEHQVAAYTLLSPQSLEKDPVMALEHVQSLQLVLGVLRSGSLMVWKYIALQSNKKTLASRIQASTFLQHQRALKVFDTTVAASIDTYVEGMYLMEDASSAAFILSTGQLVSMDLESIANEAGAEKTRALMNVCSSITDVAVHPNDEKWVSANENGTITIWDLQTNAVLQCQAMSCIPRALAWSSTGEYLAVSLANGIVSILEGMTLNPLLEFYCGANDSNANNEIKSTILSKWCTIIRYSPRDSRNYLALACRDLNIYVYTWESIESSLIYSLKYTFEGHEAPIQALDFSIGGKWLQSATSSKVQQHLRWNLEKEENSSREWELQDDEWASWTSPFAGPVEGLTECYGVDKIMALARINSEVRGKDVKTWSSSLPTVVAGLDDGRLLVTWYPLTSANLDSALISKEYVGYFSRDSIVKRIAWSFSNAFVLALIQNDRGETQVNVWKTDWEDEMRLRQRMTMKSMAFNHSSLYVRSTTLFDNYSHEWDKSHEKWVKVEKSLDLDFVYGFNPCATQSHNVFYADDTWEIVYAAGKYGVVYNTKTQTQVLNYATEDRYNSIISAMAVHPKGDLIVSGECILSTSQKHLAPKIVIWDANSSSTVVQIVSKHHRGVLLLDFNADGHRLASIGMEMDHLLALYKLSRGESERLDATLLVLCKTSCRRVWGLSLGEESNVVTCGDQHILFWQQNGEADTQFSGLKSGLLTSHKECNPHTTLLQVVHIIGRMRVVVSSQSDGSLYVWKDRNCIIVRQNAHGKTPIPALAADPNHSFVYSAGADARICLWNAQLELIRVVADIAQLQQETHFDLFTLTNFEIQALAVRDNHILFSTRGNEVCELVEMEQKKEKRGHFHVYRRGFGNGNVSDLAVHPLKSAQFACVGDSGIVQLYDAVTHSLLAFYSWSWGMEGVKDRQSNGKLDRDSGGGKCSALAFSSDGKHLAVGTLDGIVRVLLTTLDTVVTQWSCWQENEPRFSILTLKYSVCGTFLAVGCQDGSVHVYKAAGYRKVTVLRGFRHTVESMQLTFARDRALLRVQMDKKKEEKVHFWETSSWQLVSFNEIQNVQWESKIDIKKLNGTIRTEKDDAACVRNWSITTNEKFLHSIGCDDRVVGQFRLPA